MLFWSQKGQNGIAGVSIIVDVATQWWYLAPFTKKSDVSGHLQVSLMDAGPNVVKQILSDCDSVLKWGRSKRIAERYGVVLVPGAPYVHVPVGVVYRQRLQGGP